MRTILAALVVGVFLSGVGEAAPISQPLRPTAEQVSVALKRGEHFRCILYPGQTKAVITTQAERDNLQYACWTWVVRAAREVQYSLPSCQKAADNVMGRWLTSVTDKLGNKYEQRQIGGPGGGVWDVDGQGRHYQNCHAAATELQRCVTSGGFTSKECAQAVLHERLTPDVVKFLNLVVEGDNCAEGPKGGGLAGWCEDDNARESAGVLDTRKLTNPMTDFQKAKLHEAVRLHDQASDAKCGLANPPGHHAVQTALLQFEETARDETERHAWQMKSFVPITDPAHTPDELCKVAQCEKREFRCWAANLEALKWGPARGCDNDHFMCHIIENYKNNKLKVRPMCAGHFNQNHCPSFTAMEWIAQNPGLSKPGEPSPTNTPSPKPTTSPKPTVCFCPCPCEDAND